MRKRWSWYALSSLMSLVSLLAGLTLPGGSVLASSPGVPTVGSPPSGFQPTVQFDLHHDTSQPLRDMKATAGKPGSQRVALPLGKLPQKPAPQQPGAVANLQRTRGSAQMPSTVANFEGINNLCGCYPPDTNGDIGYDPVSNKRFYMEMINLDYQIWDVTNPASPVSLLGPFSNNNLWSGFGGECQNFNDGDPVVLFDEQAHRWMASQFVIPFSAGDSHQCIAISQTADPTGAWYRYDFLTSASLFIDYPHFGVWPDPTFNAYFMTAHEFNSSGTAYVGQAAFSFERSKMLTGQPAQMVYFDLGLVNLSFGGQLTADLDGAPAPAATPGYFFEVDDSGTVSDTLSIWEFRPDWTNPANSTLGLAGQPNTVLSINNFNSFGGGIPQPGTGQPLDSLADRLMHRVAYRNRGSYQSIVLNRTVDDGTGRAGVLWLEVRNTGGVWSVNQQGVYAPADGLYRWMAGIAQDVQGNIALGYSVSSSSVFPSIRYTGRLAGDPLNTLPQTEATIINGTGNQTGSAGRWGDYSMMGVDPQDQCTFWYAQEYIQTSGIANWQTRLASFKFPGCSLGPQGTLSGTVSNSSTSAPIAGATIQATSSPTVTVSASTNASGGYSVIAPVGTYTVTASAFGFNSASVSGIKILSGTVTNQNFSLSPLPPALVQGKVTDGSGHPGMPLYAQIDVSAPGFAQTIFSDPVTGNYTTTLLLNQPYNFVVTAVSGGYNVMNVAATPNTNPFAQNFALTVNTSTCNAPGYGLSVNGLSENFDSVTAPALPANWATAQVAGTDGAWFTNVGTHFPAGVAAHSPPNLVYFNSFTSATGAQTRLYRTVGLNMTTVATNTLTFWMYHESGFFGSNDTAQVQVSTNGGATWTNVGPAFIRDDGTTGWFQHSVSLSAYASATDLRLGFLGTSQFGNDVHIDDILLGATCGALPGGLVAGAVSDANTSAALNGATVTDGVSSATSFATPNDPNRGDGFYLLFTASGNRTITATTTTSGYGSDTHTVRVKADRVVSQDFHLPAGVLSASPTALQATVDLGSSTIVPITLTNSGGLAATFQLSERDGGSIIRNPLPGAPLRLIRGDHFTPGRLGSKTSVGHELEPGPLSPPWTGIANYPSPIMDNTADQFGGKVYSVGGYDGFSILNTAYAYDPVAGTWSAIASMADAREKPAAAFINGKLYVVGGWDSFGNPDAKLEIYDPTANSWTTGASTPTPLAAATAVALNGQLYVIGGCTASCGATTVLRYDPAGNAWTTLASYPEFISWEACGPINGKIYCAGGTDGSTESMHTYVYDPGANTWTALANMLQTQWAMGYTVASGLLYISGGVTNNFATITNQGYAYDPNSNAWTAIANSNNTLYRGGSACGFYKIGGSIGGFSPVPDSEVYPGLTNCAALADVTWLNEVPVTGTVASGANQSIAVTFDANVAAVGQPGQYFAQLQVASNTPAQVPAIPVTMTVNVPASWGKLTGTVTGLAYCDAPGTPLRAATVFLQSATGFTATLQTDSLGAYARWVDQANSPLTVIVSASGYLTQTRTGVNVSAGLTTTADFNLRLPEPCISVAPASISTTVSLGQHTTTPLTITNNGAAAANFAMQDTDGGFQPIVIGPSAPIIGAPAVVQRQSGAFYAGSLAAARAAHLALGGPQQPRSPNAPPWADIASYPSSIMDNTADQFGGKAYSVGGYDGFSILNTAYAYDPVAGTWSAIASMADAREKPAAAFINGKLYVVGGWDTFGNPDAKLEIYDPGANSWTTGASTPTPLAAATAVALNGQLYAIGGCTFSCGATTVLRYDPAGNAWTALASYPELTSWEACGPINGKIYCAGGTDGLTESMHTYVYDPGANTWTALANMLQTQWAMGYTVAGGLLYISGGVTNNFATITNQGYAYDPGSNTWTAIANSNNTLYRGASACGFYKIGGSSGGFSPVPNAEVLTGLGACGQQTGDAVWLTETPVTGTVASGRSQLITVNANAALVQQPGTYLATLSTQTNDPVHGNIGTPVTMTVPAPSGWGQVHGRVYGLGYCGANPQLLPNATVGIQTSRGVTATLTQDSQGDPWVWWAPRGPVTLTVAAANYLTQTLVVQISPNQGLNRDVNLRWLHNCGSVSPSPVTLTLSPNITRAVPISLTNTGTLSWTWSLAVTSTWASVSGPISGTTPADSSVRSALTINTAGMLVGSTHTALLNVTNNDDHLPSPLPILINITIARGRAVTVAAPAAAQSAKAGQEITYTLTVTNTGDAADTFAISLGNHAWKAVAPETVGPLAPGASATLNVVVTVAGDGGKSDALVVTATSTGDTSRQDSATLTTTRTD